ncbi:MAG: hypothetical protein Q7U20_02700 [Caulobacter sp.]|nr:hypothetical protein [Caulobacter sp.]
MSFDVFLIESSVTPGEVEFARSINAALASVGARRAEEGGELIITADGEFELFGTMAALRGLSPGIAGALFAMAEATSTFLVPASEEGVALRTPGNSGDAPEDFLPIVEIADPDALLRQLSGGVETWSAYRDQVIANPVPPSPPKKSWFARLLSKS